VLLACAIANERYDVVVEQARKIITQHQFDNEPLRILMASLASGLRPTDAFITSTLQKHLFREMKLSDTAVKNPEVLRWNPLNKRYAPTGQGLKSTEQDDDDGDDLDAIASVDNRSSAPPALSASTSSSGQPPIPTKQNPVIIAIYGQICIAAKSYQSAICTCSLPLPSCDVYNFYFDTSSDLLTLCHMFIASLPFTCV